MLNLVLRVAPALLVATRSAYVTLCLPDGEVLFEGDVDDGSLELCVMIPDDVTQVKAMLEAGTKYRNATVAVALDGATEFTFG